MFEHAGFEDGQDLFEGGVDGGFGEGFEVFLEGACYGHVYHVWEASVVVGRLGNIIMGGEKGCGELQCGEKKSLYARHGKVRQVSRIRAEVQRRPTREEV